MPVTGLKRIEEISQRNQYARPGLGRAYWDYRDRCVLESVVGQRVLDAGCGEGITLEKLVRRHPGAQAQGIDVDARNVAICRSHGLPAGEGSVYRLPYGDASFDTCLLIEVIEHLDEPARALAELARVLVPGGTLIVVFPYDRAMWLTRVACLRFREARFDPGHVRQWTCRALRSEAASHGLHLVRRRALPLPWPLRLHELAVLRRR